jgi:Fe-S-cluster-containing dehydrogenase component
MLVSRRSLLKGLVAGAAAALPRKAEAREKLEPGLEAVGMLYDSTRCVGCGGCVAACKEANGLPWDEPKELSNTTKTVIHRKPVAAASAGAPATALIKRQCMQCVDPPCASACMLGALHKEGEGKRDMGGERKGTGIVIYDKSLCLGCRYCQIACPYAIPKFEWFEQTPRIVKCELCRQRADKTKEGPLAVANPACCQVCPAEAVIYGRRAELLAEAKKRLAESPERYNPKIFGESDGGGTQVLYLAGAGVTFKELGLPDLKEYSNAYFSEKVSHAPYLHGITPIALYATAALVIRRNHRVKQEKAAPSQGKGK